MTSAADAAGVGVDDLPPRRVQEALRLLGAGPDSCGPAASRALRERLAAGDTVPGLLATAPAGAPEAFARLAAVGPLAVEALLGRGWWGRGALPPPLDWLQRRALVAVGADGLVHAIREARPGWGRGRRGAPAVGGGQTGRRGAPAASEAGRDGDALWVEEAGAVVVAAAPHVLDRALGVAPARLRAVAPTVALSSLGPGAVRAALRAAGVSPAEHAVVPAAAGAPALPAVAEDAVGPRAVRALVRRGLEEGRQLRLWYFASSRGGAATDRVVDPWAFSDDLLRGYCHLRAAERTFAVDRIGHARLLPDPVDHATP